MDEHATYTDSLIRHISERRDLSYREIIQFDIWQQPFLSNKAKAMAARGPVGMDVQGFVRVPEGDTLVFKPWKDMAEGLAHITYLKADKAEAESLTGETDLERAAHKLAAYGPKEIVLTQSSGVTVYANGRICRAPFTPKNLSGRTGRGDTVLRHVRRETRGGCLARRSLPVGRGGNHAETGKTRPVAGNRGGR